VGIDGDIFGRGLERNAPPPSICGGGSTPACIIAALALCTTWLGDCDEGPKSIGGTDANAWSPKLATGETAGDNEGMDGDIGAMDGERLFMDGSGEISVFVGASGGLVAFQDEAR